MGLRRLAIALAFILPTYARAQRAPDVTIVAPAAPGGGWDQTARVMQQVLRETGLAGSVQVVNAAGAAGTIGLARFVTSEKGNPNALLVTGLVMVSGIAVNRSPVTLADAAPIARLSGEYEVIVVPAASPMRTLADLVAAFRANPRAVSWGGGSAGGTDEILVRLLADRAGVPAAGVNYIAYSGGGQALASVLGGHVTAAVSGLGEFGAQIESGDLRALALSAPERLPGVAIPTFREQGVDVDLLNWRGVMAAPGLTRVERTSLAERVRAMAASSQWKSALERSGWADIYIEGDEFARFLVAETARVAPLVASADRGPRGTDVFELFVLVGLAIASLATLVRTMLLRRAPAAVASLNRRSPNTKALGLLALALLMDVALMERGGFVLASALMFWLCARAFGSRRPVRDAIIGLALAVVIHVAFTRGLGVRLPGGIGARLPSGLLG